MIPQKSIETYISSVKPNFDTRDLFEVISRVTSNKALTPVQALEGVLGELFKANIEVYHQSISTVSLASLPGFLFINGKWSFLTKTEENLELIDEFDDVKNFNEISEIPVSIFVGVKVREINSETDELTEFADAGYTTIFGIIKKHALRRKRWIVDIAIATVMVNVFTLLTSMFAMQVYDRVVPTLAFDTLYTLSIGVMVIYVTDFMLKKFRANLLDDRTAHIDQGVSKEVYDHLLRVQMDKMPLQLGTLTGQISGLESARQFFTSSAVFVIVDFPFCILFIAMIYLVAGPVSFVYAGFLFISLVLGYISQKLSQRLIKKMTSKSNEKLGFLVDTIRGLEAIKTFGATSQLAEKWSALTFDISKVSTAQKNVSHTASTLASTMGQFAYLIAIILGVHQISEGTMTQGSMIAVSILGGRVLGPAGQAVNHMLQFETTRQTMELINGLLKLPLEKKADEKPVMPMDRIRTISLQGVSFQYQNEKADNLAISSLELKAGERVALLGSIGSGKSTLIKLLARLYKPSQGTIKIDGMDLWQIDEDFLHNQIGYHSQSPELFKGTLKENLIFGRGVADKHLTSTINELGINIIAEQSEKGLDRDIFEGGAGLSGGQKQMISLARLLVAGKCLWLFDEPTASLDVKSQERFVKTLKSKMRSDDILVFSTHNVKMAMDISTRIIVLENGKITKDSPTSAVQVRRSA